MPRPPTELQATSRGERYPISKVVSFLLLGQPLCLHIDLPFVSSLVWTSGRSCKGSWSGDMSVLTAVPGAPLVCCRGVHPRALLGLFLP